MPDAPQFEATQLTPLVRRLLDEPAAEVAAWHAEPLAWINLMDAALHRVTGTARIQGQTVDWSMVIKRFPRPEGEVTATDPAGWDYWKREVNAYASGTLDTLPGGFVTPRFAGVVTQPDGALWLALEEIRGIEDRPWSLDRFEAVARCAGSLNGAYVDGVARPAVDGLGAGGLRSWVELLAEIVAEPPGDGALAAVATPRRDELLALMASREQLLKALDRLPQTFVHRDLTPVNVLVRTTAERPEEFIAIDWALAGAGAIGEDAAGLVGATLWQLIVDPSRAEALEERVLRGYAAGLDEAGWHGNEADVWFGYAATLGLRFAPLTPGWARNLDDPAKAEWFRTKFGRPPDEVAIAWGRLQEFVVARGTEAVKLADQLQKARST